ncbi:hypothetical protein [Neobacillus sp. 114]|uniref:hypothetical protein n=1 Tax=Neobacillus sp. 114 TaxID=3048535 RepID=UPI0024C3F6B1|nr:hypothetical protein [Neobacillus sp. 114]
MERMKGILNSFIVVFSEGIWIYYTIVLFTSLEWNKFVSFSAAWWWIAGIAGYFLNVFLSKRTFLVGVMANLLFMGIVLYQNWKTISVPDGAWFFGLAISIAAGFIWIRIAGLYDKKPKRRDMLRCFEVNIILYLVFAFTYMKKGWEVDALHVSFILAIAISLIGMILSLQSHAQDDEGYSADIRKVGHAGPLTSLLIAALVSIPFFSLVLLLPGVNKAVISVGVRFWEGLKWAGSIAARFILWVVGLFPGSHIGKMEILEPRKDVMAHDAVKETVSSFSTIWLIVGIAVVLSAVFMFVLVKVLKNKQTISGMKPKQVVISKESWWGNFKRKLWALMNNVKVNWRKRFPHFYYDSVYWYYYQLQRWGKKNGFPVHKTETSQEYINRIIKEIPPDKTVLEYEGKKYGVKNLLEKLNQDYQAAYYGGVPSEAQEEYRILLKGLW